MEIIGIEALNLVDDRTQQLVLKSIKILYEYTVGSKLTKFYGYLS